MLLSATPLAMTAYEAGEIAGGLVPLGLGIALIVVGLRRRRASAPPAPDFPSGEAPGVGGTPAHPDSPAAVQTVSWTPAPEPDLAAEPAAPATPNVTHGPDRATAPAAERSAPWPPALPAAAASGPNLSPDAPVRKRGTGLLIGGAVLVVLTLAGGAVRVADRAAAQRRVELPTSVLGLARDQAASAQVGTSALSNVPAGLTDPQAAVYGTLPNALLVIAARASTSRPADQLEAFRKGLEKSGGTLEKGRDVDAGRLGGAARCWEGVIGGIRPGVCVFVDRGSLVATIDFLGGGVEEAAKRGRQVREATVTKK